MTTATRGYFRLKEAWYAKHLKPRDDVADEVMFGLYHKDGGGTAGEMKVEWVWLETRARPTARLAVFDEAFPLLAQLGDVLCELAKTADIEPCEFCDLLRGCGFKDLTERVRSAR